MQVMRIDLERHQVQGLETHGIDDRHIVGGHDRRTRHVGSGTPTDIRNPRPYPCSDLRQQAIVVQGTAQFPGIAPADHHPLRIANRCDGIGKAVNAFDANAQRGKDRRSERLIVVIAACHCRVGNEEQPIDVP